MHPRYLLLRIGLWCFCSTLAAPQSAQASEYQYPKDAPVMTMMVPDGWTLAPESTPEARLLKITSGLDRNFGAFLVTLSPGVTAINLPVALTQLAKVTARATRFADLTVSQPHQEKLGEGPRSYLIVRCGGSVGDAEAAYTFAAFTLTDGGRCYVLGWLGTRESLLAHQAEIEKLASSIQPVASASATALPAAGNGDEAVEYQYPKRDPRLAFTLPTGWQVGPERSADQLRQVSTGASWDHEYEVTFYTTPADITAENVHEKLLDMARGTTARMRDTSVSAVTEKKANPNLPPFVFVHSSGETDGAPTTIRYGAFQLTEHGSYFMVSEAGADASLLVHQAEFAKLLASIRPSRAAPAVPAEPEPTAPPTLPTGGTPPEVTTRPAEYQYPHAAPLLVFNVPAGWQIKMAPTAKVQTAGLTVPSDADYGADIMTLPNDTTAGNLSTKLAAFANHMEFLPETATSGLPEGKPYPELPSFVPLHLTGKIDDETRSIRGGAFQLEEFGPYFLFVEQGNDKSVAAHHADFEKMLASIHRYQPDTASEQVPASPTVPEASTATAKVQDLRKHGIGEQREGRFDAAIADYNRALALAPEFASLYNERGTVLQSKGDVDAAMADYTRAIELDSQLTLAYNNRAGAKQAKGDLAGALADLSHAIVLAPDEQVYTNRAFVRSAQKDFDGALDDANRAINLNPLYTGAYFGRANAENGKGEFGAAIRDYSRVVELDPKFESVYFNRGTAESSNNELDRALADLGRAIKANPKHPAAYTNRASVYARKGDLDAALADLSKAIELDPGQAVNYTDRAAVRDRKGDADGARADSARASELDPKQNP